MAQSKFLMYGAVLFTLFVSHLNTANPGSEWCEIAEARSNRVRADSPRQMRPAAHVRVPPRQAREESCCWSFLNVFCTIMEHSGAQFPHPIIRIQDRANQ